MRLPFDLGALWARALAWYNGYSQRDRRIILGVLVCTVASLVYLSIVTPILAYQKSIEQEITDGQEELERAMRFLAAKDTLRAEREDLRKRLTQAKGRLLPGGTGTLGAAALQERANAIASERGITVQSTQVMKDEVMDPYRKVSVRLSISGELKPLAELVSGLEYERQLGIPFIEVSRRGAVAGAKGPRNLSVTLEVTGFVQGGAKGDAAGKGEGTDGEAADVGAADAAASADAGDAAPADAEATGALAASPDAAPTTSTTTTAALPGPTAPAATTPTTMPAAGAGRGVVPPRRAASAGAVALGAPALPGIPTTSTPVTIPSLPVPITFPSLVIPTPLPHGAAAEGPDAEGGHAAEPAESAHPAEPVGPEAAEPVPPVEEKLDADEGAE